MEFLPFAYCESVCALLRDLSDLEIVCRDNPDCAFWSSAIKENYEKRPTVSLYVGHERGQWSHAIYFAEKSVSFQRFRAAYKEKNFRFEEISFCPAYYSHCAHFDRIQSTEEEIEKIIKYTASYIYKTDFEILNSQSYAHFPQEFFETILVTYKNRSFRKICLQTLHHSLFEEFVRTQLKSAHLKELHLPELYPQGLRAGITEFSLTNMFRKLLPRVPDVNVGNFKKLFKAPNCAKVA